MKSLGVHWRNFVAKVFAFLVATIGKGVLRMLLWTCQVQVEGLEHYRQTVSEKKCLLMLWHNRLAIAPFILFRYARDFTYAALVSNSRDGKLISSVVEPYKQGRTIRVPHNSRSEALRLLVKHIQENSDIVVITPDGPRGPRYTLKPGIALAAMKTGAWVIPFTWEANRYWEFKTWDKLRLPKPFSKIEVTFGQPIELANDLEQAKKILQDSLPSNQ